MPERKIKKQTEWKLPSVRISAPELYEIISAPALNHYHIYAETCDYKFKDLDDIRNHLDLFTNDPTIYIGDSVLRLSWDMLGSKLSCNYKCEKQLQEALKIFDILQNKLLPYRPFIFSFFGRLLMRIIISAIASYYTTLNILSIFGTQNQTVFIAVYALFALGYFGLTDDFLGMIAPKGPVLAPKKRSFWSRNQDAIAVGIIATVIGTGLLLIIPFIFDYVTTYEGQVPVDQGSE